MKSFGRFPSRIRSSHKGGQFNTEIQHNSKFTPIKRGLFNWKESNKFSPRRKISFFRRKNARLNLVDKSSNSKNDHMDAASLASSSTEEKAFIEDAESKSFESLDDNQEDESDIHPDSSLDSRSSNNVVLIEEQETPSMEEMKESINQETSSIRKELSEELNDSLTEESTVQEKESSIYDEALSQEPKEEFMQNINIEQEKVILQNDLSLKQAISLFPVDSSLLVELKTASRTEESRKTTTNIHVACIVFTSTFLFYVIGGLGLISNLVGFFYPAYMSLKTIGSTNKANNSQWVTYWIVFSVFSMVESTIPFLTWFVPYYFHFKIGFFLWLYHPKVMGAKKVYNDAIRA